MRNAILAALVVLTAAACGGYQFPGASPSPQTGTVSGRVLSVPCAPVEQAGQTCAGRPVPNLSIVFASAGETASTTTDSNGAYSIRLDAGTYKVTIKNYMRIISGPPSITVPAGGSVVANYLLDNGIRVPVPQQ